jgi:hypothetical protein
MRLGRLIELLREIDPAKIVANGFGAPASYRGYYEDLAFEPAHNVSIGYMLKHAESALGKVFEGYKGGDYLAQSYTRCWIADWGETADEPIHPYDLARWKSSPCMSQLKWPVNTSVTYLEDERKGVVVEETETEAIPPTPEESISAPIAHFADRCKDIVASAETVAAIAGQILAQRIEGEADSAERLPLPLAARSGIESALAEAGRKIRENDQQLEQAYWGLIDLMGEGIKTIKVGSYILRGTSDRDGVMIKVIDLELPLGRDETSI